MITSRRSLFGFGAALIAAPAIVRVASIMPVSVAQDPMTLARIRAVATQQRIREWMAAESPGQYRMIVSETWLRVVMGDQADITGFIVCPDRLPA